MALVQRRIEQLLVATAAQRQSIMYSVDAKEAWTGSANLYDLLKNSYRFNAGDPRDIVYAFLGLVDPSYTFEADYSPSMSPIQTFVQATEKVIRAENSLAVLRQTVLQARDNHGLWLPSWAPDWTSGATIGPHYMEMRSVMSGSFIRFRQLPKSLSLIPIGVAKVEWDVTGRTLAKLMVRALLVGTLLEVVHDDYGWSRVFRIDTSPEFKVVTSAQGRSKQQVWVIDGAPGFFVLRRQQQGTYSVVHAAGIYIVSRDNMEAESRAIYESVVEAENRGERSPEILSLI
jgi:hypothetical protein